MRKHRNIELTETPATIRYAALVAAITEKIKESGDYINCNNIEQLKRVIDTAEKE